MPSALEKLVKILKLERDQGYNDTAVIGGLGAFSSNWRREAHQQAKIEQHHLMVDDVSQLLDIYGSVESVKERHEMVMYMLDRAMMRVTEPRADFVPRHDWQSDDGAGKLLTPTASPVNKKGKLKKRNTEKPERAARKGKTVGRKKAVNEQSTQPNPNTSHSDGEGASFFRGTVSEIDLPDEPRLERPPRKPRPDMPFEAASDALHALRKPVAKVVRGVGSRMSEKLARLKIETLEDLLYYQPRRYDDYTRMAPISQLEPEQVVTVIGTVRQSHLRTVAGGRQDFAFTLDDGSGRMEVIFFGQRWMRQTIRDGMQLVVSGRTSIYRDRLQMSAPEWEPLDGDNLHTRTIVPVYRLTQGIGAKRLRVMMRQVVNYWPRHIPDFVPEHVLERCDLADLGWALEQIHFPDGWDHLGHAQRRLAFDHLLLLQLAILQRRREWQSVPAQPIAVEDGWLDTFVEAVFPYELTGAQVRVVNDIRDDIGQVLPMNRLIQGDVGSGKTAVAIIAMAMAVQGGKQAALMAPTSILAEQHYRSVQEAFADAPMQHPARVALLTSAIPRAEREAVYEGLASGEIDIVVGTHAIIQEGVAFDNLGLAIIDEQHRFGVEHRGSLRGKGYNPHLLVMTATPIPRTITLTLHADLDLSVIDEMPPGRTPVKTRVRTAARRELIYEFIRQQVNLGRQAFIVYPLVEDSDKVEAESAVTAYEQLQEVFYQQRLGILHGRMKPNEKDEVMRAFAAGEFDILVTTSVAEVGVNIPNATVMLIEGANRFGLSQLHQFRGRVGRGKYPGYCILVPDKWTEEAELRLNAMQETTDGFLLSEIDWKLRGGGDILSTQQSGQSWLQIQREASPELVELAMQEARTIYAEDPDLSMVEHQLLRERVLQLQDTRADLS